MFIFFSAGDDHIHRMVYFCNRKCNAKSRTERTCARILESCPVNILVSIFQPASQQEESFILNGSQVHHHPVVTHLSLFFSPPTPELRGKIVGMIPSWVDLSYRRCQRAATLAVIETPGLWRKCHVVREWPRLPCWQIRRSRSSREVKIPAKKHARAGRNILSHSLFLSPHHTHK